MIALDVTDLVEFLGRRESVSGVQRVIAETVPLLRESLTDCGYQVRSVMLDRVRGDFVEVPSDLERVLIDQGARTGSGMDRAALAEAAERLIERSRILSGVEFSADDVLVFLGALWISDAAMLAGRRAHASGARVVSLLYDLTPVMDAGHTAAVNSLFDRYLTMLLQVASRVPAISQSSRRDFEAYAESHSVPAPPGGSTGLPCGLRPADAGETGRPWPRPYALMVGTIEGRKNHELALRVWRRLIEAHGPEAVPDLVCIGRLGWNATPFLRELTRTNGLDGKVHARTTGVSDQELAAFYAHAEFTVYPSRYEGWGLPVSESLAFGVPAIVADNSSLREAGQELAIYFTTDDEEAFTAAVTRYGLDPVERDQWRARIRATEQSAITWRDVAERIQAEIEAALREEARPPVCPTVEIGQEIVLAPRQPAPDAGHADRVFAHLVATELTPLLRRPRDDRDHLVADAALTGLFGSPQTWGLEVHPGRRVTLALRRPVSGPLVALFATRSMPGQVTVDVSGPGGSARAHLYLGSVLELPLGDGNAGEVAQSSLTVVDASDSIEGFLGLRSFVILSSDDVQAQLVALRNANEALRNELDFITGTRSWRLTAPLRRWKGRGAS